MGIMKHETCGVSKAEISDETFDELVDELGEILEGAHATFKDLVARYGRK